MKKGTKIITTAISLVLVLSFMVVGILAATSATAGISASISWTAEKGVAFTIDAWTWQSAEHYDENSKSFPEISSHKIEQIVVDTATTNQQASGISKSLNANFIDTTDDGVNNPHELYYVYRVESNMLIDYETGRFPHLRVKIELPISTADVDVEFSICELGGFESGTSVEKIRFDRYRKSNAINEDQISMLFVSVRLTLLNPDVSLSNFDASVRFEIEEGISMIIA